MRKDEMAVAEAACTLTDLSASPMLPPMLDTLACGCMYIAATGIEKQKFVDPTQIQTQIGAYSKKRRSTHGV